MIAYRYDKTTRIYLGAYECQVDPLESEIAGHPVWLLPANATFKAPPKEQDGFNIIWNNDSWEYKEIHEESNIQPECTLEKAKEAKIAELKHVRDTKELEPIAYNGDNYDFDLKSYNRIMAAVDVLDRADIEYQQLLSTLPEEELITTNQNLLEPLPDHKRPSITWTTTNNDNVELTADGLHGIIAAAAARSNTLHAQYRILKMAVENADSVSSVQAIEWNNIEDYM